MFWLLVVMAFLLILVGIAFVVARAAPPLFDALGDRIYGRGKPREDD